MFLGILINTYTHTHIYIYAPLTIQTNTTHPHSQIPHHRRPTHLHGPDGLLQDHGPAAQEPAAQYAQVRSCRYVFLHRSTLWILIQEIIHMELLHLIYLLTQSTASSQTSPFPGTEGSQEMKRARARPTLGTTTTTTTLIVTAMEIVVH